MIFQIARLELRRFFSSPMSWLVLFAVTTFSAFRIINSIGHALRVQTLFDFGQSSQTSNILSLQGSFFANLELMLIVAMPMICMGILSREKASDSYKLLFSSPISLVDIILGKAMSQLLICVAFTLVVAICIFPVYLAVENAQVGIMLSGLLGAFLLMLMASAVVLFFSTLTKYPVFDVLGTITLFGILLVIGNFFRGTPLLEDLTRWMALREHTLALRNGYILSRDVFYFLAVSAFFVFLAYHKLRLDKATRSERPVIWMQIGVLGTAVIAAGLFLSQPRYTAYGDVTAGGDHTISDEVKQALLRIDEPIQITTYINVLGDNLFSFLPKNQRSDQRQFERYQRFFADLSFDYQYYYQSRDSRQLFSAHERGLSEDALLIERLKRFGISRDDIRRADQVPDIDLGKFDFGHVRQIRIGDQSAVVSASFDDPIRGLTDREFLATLDRIAGKGPRAGVLAQNLERSIQAYRPTGWRTAMLGARNRNSLSNLGFSVDEVSFEALRDGVAPDILVIADPQDAYSPVELAQLQDFLNAGGNALIAAEPANAENINAITKSFGVTMRAGTLVNGAQGRDADQVPVVFKEQYWASEHDAVGGSQAQSTTPSRHFRQFQNVNRFKSAGALEVRATEGSRINTLFQSAGDDSWLDQTGPDLLGDVEFEPMDGDVRGTFPIAVAVDRTIDNRQQRIIILADADLLSDQQMGRGSSMAEPFALLLTHGNRPVLIPERQITDSSIRISPGKFRILRWVYWAVIPWIFAVAGMAIWLRRRAPIITSSDFSRTRRTSCKFGAMPTCIIPR